MACGLFFVSAKPLTLCPNAPATLTIVDLLRGNNRQLQVYDILQHHTKSRPPGLALSLIDDPATMKMQAAHQLQSLPPLPRDSIDDDESAIKDGSAGATASDEPPKKDILEQDESKLELPPNLHPVLMYDDIPLLADDEELFNDHDSSFDFDGLDVKNLPDYDPHQNSEAELYTDDVDAWIHADKEESIKGVRPRLYERWDILKETSLDVILSKDHDAFPLISSLTLAPYLFICQIPAEGDEEFLRMFHRYAYLTSHDHYRRVSCFKQDDPSFPRWLLVQEFTSFRDDCALKKEAEYWWRKNGWEGVLLEFFRLREA